MILTDDRIRTKPYGRRLAGCLPVPVERVETAQDAVREARRLFA
ncbi:hypothetical protein L0Y59_00370 [Candidatus Uhrbacteria bacterium]|nr:hypothetical protein [Candidatus Uhrbacteria bacterium]